MRSLDDTDTVDVLGTVHMLRQDRAGAVQTQEQYFFIYEVSVKKILSFAFISMFFNKKFHNKK